MVDPGIDVRKGDVSESHETLRFLAQSGSRRGVDVGNLVCATGATVSVLRSFRSCHGKVHFHYSCQAMRSLTALCQWVW